MSKKTWADFVVPADQLRGGLCDDVKPALYYPGFPTFKHLDHRSYLQKMGVTVFQQASRLAASLTALEMEFFCEFHVHFCVIFLVYRMLPEFWNVFHCALSLKYFDVDNFRTDVDW